MDLENDSDASNLYSIVWYTHGLIVAFQLFWEEIIVPLFASDQPVVKTLETLSTMYKNKGNMKAAIDALHDVF
jgi:hypothetical protein